MSIWTHEQRRERLLAKKSISKLKKELLRAEAGMKAECAAKEEAIGKAIDAVVVRDELRAIVKELRESKAMGEMVWDRTKRYVRHRDPLSSHILTGDCETLAQSQVQATGPRAPIPEPRRATQFSFYGSLEEMEEFTSTQRNAVI